MQPAGASKALTDLSELLAAQPSSTSIGDDEGSIAEREVDHSECEQNWSVSTGAQLKRKERKAGAGLRGPLGGRATS